ncbi:MAG: hypothetical protein SPL73_07220 [Cyanobacteriota bacterium]|nr:hypothetical protein [Cyanobacteriota bacterium]MDY6359480.1 hypothetical protein [Cyanobacteriota bacterium]MDY6364662.1 hypothetical protein [Cyanobacteriota bacterium]MDY6382753.1 hypothetical protein [Cyanobacteriota bacterium]
MKKFFVILALLSLTLPAFAKPGTIVSYTIDPEKNAWDHNNKGVEYMSEKCYYAAIQEFKIAISLNPKAQSTAIYMNNLGKVYLVIGYPELAVGCFEDALKQYSLNFEFYENLAKCYKQLGKASSQLSAYKAKEKTNPTAQIMVGLLQEQTGNIRQAITTLDDFAMSEPDLIITPAVKKHIKDLVKKINR